MSATLLHIMYIIVPCPRLMFLHPNLESAKMLVWTNMSFRMVQLLIYSKEL